MATGERVYRMGKTSVKIEWYRINPRTSAELALYNVFVSENGRITEQVFDADIDQLRSIRDRYQSKANRSRKG